MDRDIATAPSYLGISEDGQWGWWSAGLIVVMPGRASNCFFVAGFFNIMCMDGMGLFIQSRRGIISKKTLRTQSGIWRAVS